MKKFFEEFKEFINQGNVDGPGRSGGHRHGIHGHRDSVVSDLIMPLISLVTGGIDFSDMKIPLGTGPDAAAFTYGNFINAVIQFLIIALVVFLIVKALSRARMLTRRGKHIEEQDAPKCPFCLEEVNEGATQLPALHRRAARPRRGYAESGRQSVGVSTDRLLIFLVGHGAQDEESRDTGDQRCRQDSRFRHGDHVRVDETRGSSRRWPW